jgi:hypothetical protein
MKSAIIAILLPVSAGLSVLGPGTALARPPSRRDLLERDVGVAAFLLPDTVDSGTVIAPRVVVGNYGLYAETFPVYLRGPGVYEHMGVVTVDAGVYDTILYPIWREEYPRGWRSVVAWTLLEGDENPGNDTLWDSVFVRVRDIGVEDILIRVDTVPDDSFLVYLRCAVRNYGNAVESFEVLTGGPDRETIFGLPGQTPDTATFDPILLPSGVYLLWAKVVPSPWPDMNTSNDIMYDTLWLPGRIRHDVGVVEIVSPVGRHDTVGVLDVSATVRNYGESTETFWTHFGIFDQTNARVYQDSVQTVDLAAGSSAELTFRRIDLNEIGFYTARCSTYLAKDQNWTNNLVTGVFRVEAPGGVQESQSLPPVFGLDAIRPNPFRAKAAAKFTLSEPSRVDLAVYSSDGRRVRRLACGSLDAGRYEVVWDGCGEAGRPVVRSVYYLRFVAGDYVQHKKLVKTE